MHHTDSAPLAPIIIIGSGQAGVSLARELRKKSKTRAITLISQDAGGFYSKPTLSNAFFKQTSIDQLHTQDATTLADKIDINVMPQTSVTTIDTEKQTITTQDGATLDYSSLVIAVGGLAFRPAIDGLEQAMSINNLDDYLKLRNTLKALSKDQPAKVAIVGGGLVGCELANDICLSGAQVTLIERENQLLPKLASASVSQALQQKLESLKIQCRTSTCLTSITHSPSHGYLLNSSDHQANKSQAHSLHADIIISALGIKPSIELAQRAGLRIHHGIMCNTTLETSAPNVYTLGDCAEINGLVLPYILPIMQAAKALAATLTGEPTSMNPPCLPIAVKTTSYPLVVCPPKQISTARIEEIKQDDSITTLYYHQEQLVGFCLSGEATKQRQALASQTLSLFEQ